MTKLKATLAQDNGDWVLRLSGGITCHASQPAWSVDVLIPIKKNNIKVLSINLGGLDNIDSRGLKFLFDIQEALSTSDVQIILQNPTDHLLRLFRIMQFDQIFVIEIDKPQTGSDNDG